MREALEASTPQRQTAAAMSSLVSAATWPLMMQCGNRALLELIESISRFVGMISSHPRPFSARKAIATVGNLRRRAAA
ncbi:hypothetical protein [Bradyrhizobium sp. HKCCYLR20261]|uniref:hypothetical protein n=1 Tax=Bradyrhizobium sp. HKCCYLR20261 TaxID=3420760 RepID=UPI003EBDF5AD